MIKSIRYLSQGQRVSISKVINFIKWIQSVNSFWLMTCRPGKVFNQLPKTRKL